ncbi:MAG TPA: hypothetical protein VHZ51_19910 [Ktedonobacteraceae bacterium]|jgi:predicted transcriptional regulator|nr:hypothetical protein [Ktedonobacteraceae bacterium]
MEQAILETIKAYNAKYNQPLTVREIQRRRSSFSTKVIQEMLRHLTRAQVVQEIRTEKTYRYQIVEDEA